MSNQGSLRNTESDRLPIELEAWIEAARLGDRESLGRALLGFRDYLILVANEEADPGLQAKEGASDLVQETLLRAYRRFGSFRGHSLGEWRGWLRRILLRQLSSQRRRFSRTQKRRSAREVAFHIGLQAVASHPVETPSRTLLRAERHSALLNAIARLPEHYRMVVLWHHRERLPFEEIGQRLGISAEAARKLWSRALRCLREELGPLVEAG
jgi:RNA polymerase sigma-70 factor (ECF subfamily)